MATDREESFGASLVEALKEIRAWKRAAAATAEISRPG